jgi:hypothetical protein
VIQTGDWLVVMAVLHSLRRQITDMAGPRFAAFAVLFCFVFAGWIPVAEVHEHANASYGHSHDVQDHDAWNAGKANEIASADDASQLHFHDSGAQSPTMLSSYDIAPVLYGQTGRGALTPATRPPDNPKKRLYRPPIA